MYRDDQEATLQRAESATREADQLRAENEAMRRALVAQQPAIPTYAMMQPAAVYPNLDPRYLPLPERARLAQHSLERFPVAAAVVLNYLTLGLFGLFYYSGKHGRLPQAAPDDPSAGKAIGFQFIPYYNLYWVFFNSRRLCDRLDLQMRLRGLPNVAPKAMMTTACIFSVIPYVGWALAYLIFWPIASGMLQSAINKVAALPPSQFDATLLPPPAYGVPLAPYGLAAPPPPTWR
ncbi:MAG: DUF4234 domain-containing protein [Myxococcales bacterium]|nr:DUF4234 domain-containing protein [Myxococcales bacterium]